MEVINPHMQSEEVYRNCVSCAHQFTTEVEKNAHILAHFEQRVCEDCDQNLLRIGDNFYVLHATLTCIRRCEIKQEIESDEQNHSELSRIKVHPIDARQYDNSYVKQEQTNDGSNQLDTMAVQIDPSSLAFQGPEFDETNKQLNSTTFSTESNSNEKLYEKSKALMVSLLNSLSAKEVPPKSPESPNRIKKYPCTYDGCNASYKTSSSRTLHIYRIHGSKRFECEECKKTFPTGSEFRRHVKTHGAQEKYSCDKCGMTNVSQRSLQRLHEHPKYKCDECGVAFCRHDQLRDHENYVHHKPLDISKCPVDGCNKMLTAAKRRDHMARMHKVIQHTCDVCQQIFTSFNQLREHMNDHGIKSQGYDCSHCGTTGISKETLENHHSKQNFTCKWCDRRFCLRTQLKQHHLQDSCKPETPISRSLANKLLKRYKCKVEGCNEMVSTNNRSYHMATKHTAKNEQFQCDICKKSAATKSMIRFHILRMHVPSSKKFKCNLCGKAYLSQSILDWHHTYSHVKEKKFMCDECGATFCRKAQLKVHITKHTGEKPFQCTFAGCSKGFRTHAGRTEHMRSHTKEKPFECPIPECDRKFAYAVDLRRHKFNAHGIYTKKFPCRICAEIFPENVLLKKHMQKHEMQV